MAKIRGLSMYIRNQMMWLFVVSLIIMQDNYAETRLPMLKVTNFNTSNIQTPAEILNIGPSIGQNHFLLQYAILGEKKYSTASQDQIAHANFDTYCPYFCPSDNKVLFYVEAGAPETSGAHGPRSELRQVNQDGSLAAFTLSEGTHRLQGVTSITHYPPINKEVVIMQLFNDSKSTDAVSIRTQEYTNGSYALVVRNNGKNVATLANPYRLNEEFSWKVTITDGILTIDYNDENVTLSNNVIAGADSDLFYFKAGCYGQIKSETLDDLDEYYSTTLSNLIYENF